jgi:hypothetical protein
MESAQDLQRFDAPGPLDRARNGRILRPGRNTKAGSFRQLRRFQRVINSDKVFGTHRVILISVVAAFPMRWICGRMRRAAIVGLGREIAIMSKSALAWDLFIALCQAVTPARGND